MAAAVTVAAAMGLKALLVVTARQGLCLTKSRAALAPRAPALHCLQACALLRLLLLGLLLRLLPRPARGAGEAARRASPCTSTTMEQNGQLSILTMLLLASRAIIISVQHQLMDTTTTCTCNVLEPHRVPQNGHLWWLPLCALQNKHHILGKTVGISSGINRRSFNRRYCIESTPVWHNRNNHGCFQLVDSACA